VPGVSGTGVETRPEAGAEAGREISPWDWTDVLLSLVFGPPIALAIGFGLITVVIPLLPGSDHGLRNAMTNLLGDVALYAGLLGAAVGLVVQRRRASPRALGLRRASLSWIAAAVPLGVLAYVLATLVGLIGVALLPHAQNCQPTTVRRAFGGYVPLAVVLVTLIAPFAEETLFRGFLFGWLRGRAPLWMAVVVSAALFAASHVQPVLLLPTFVLGCLLALVYQRSGSLVPGMIVHGVFNAVGIAGIFLLPPTPAPNCPAASAMLAILLPR
jgi:membrane protease YdiL (CAAX protease family)